MEERSGNQASVPSGMKVLYVFIAVPVSLFGSGLFGSGCQNLHHERLTERYREEQKRDEKTQFLLLLNSKKSAILNAGRNREPFQGRSR
jgi:hypothetical protein